MTGFKQIYIEDWKPGPFHPIAALSTTMAELCSMHGFEPECVEEDGLGVVSYVFLELADGTRFILEWGELGPSTNVTISADVRDPAYAATMKKLLSALMLDTSAVIHQCDDGFYDEGHERQRAMGLLE